MNLHIKTRTHKLLFFFLFTPTLFADILPPNTLPFQTIQEANEAYEKGEFRKSARLFKSLNSTNPTVAYDQANAEYKAGMYGDALRSYAKAKGVDEATRLYNVGNCYFKKGDYSLAVSNYTNSLKLKNDEDVMHNLKLARKKRAEKAKKEREDKEKKDKDKKKEDEEKKKREEEEKKKKEEEQKKKDEQKKKEDEKKDDKKKESDEKNSKSEKDADASEKQETETKMSPEEKMRKKELSHLVKQLSKKKMPTMMYQGKENKGGRDDKNPW